MNDGDFFDIIDLRVPDLTCAGDLGDPDFSFFVSAGLNLLFVGDFALRGSGLFCDSVMLDTDIMEDSTEEMCSRLDGRGVSPSVAFISIRNEAALMFLSDSCLFLGGDLLVGRLQAPPVVCLPVAPLVAPCGDRIDLRHDCLVSYLASVSAFLGSYIAGTSLSLNLTVGMALKVRSPVSF